MIFFPAVAVHQMSALCQETDCNRLDANPFPEAMMAKTIHSLLQVSPVIQGLIQGVASIKVTTPVRSKVWDTPKPQKGLWCHRFRPEGRMITVIEAAI